MVSYKYTFWIVFIGVFILLSKRLEMLQIDLTQITKYIWFKIFFIALASIHLKSELEKKIIPQTKKEYLEELKKFTSKYNHMITNDNK